MSRFTDLFQEKEPTPEPVVEAVVEVAPEPVIEDSPEPVVQLEEHSHTHNHEHTRQIRTSWKHR